MCSLHNQFHLDLDSSIDSSYSSCRTYIDYNIGSTCKSINVLMCSQHELKLDLDSSADSSNRGCRTYIDHNVVRCSNPGIVRFPCQIDQDTEAILLKILRSSKVEDLESKERTLIGRGTEGYIVEIPQECGATGFGFRPSGEEGSAQEYYIKHNDRYICFNQLNNNLEANKTLQENDIRFKFWKYQYRGKEYSPNFVNTQSNDERIPKNAVVDVIVPSQFPNRCVSSSARNTVQTIPHPIPKDDADLSTNSDSVFIWHHDLYKQKEGWVAFEFSYLAESNSHNFMAVIDNAVCIKTKWDLSDIGTDTEIQFRLEDVLNKVTDVKKM